MTPGFRKLVVLVALVALIGTAVLGTVLGGLAQR